MTDEIVKIVQENISCIHDNWINKQDTNCYMFALNLDINLEKLHFGNRFCIGMLSGTYKKDMSKEDMVSSLYKDVDIIGLSIDKYDNGILLDDEWLIALFNNEINDDFHFLRTYPKIYNKPNYWYHKKGFGGIICHTDSSSKDIVDPKKTDLRLYICRHLTIPYKYVDTFKLSVKKDF